MSLNGDYEFDTRLFGLSGASGNHLKINIRIETYYQLCNIQAVIVACGAPSGETS